ncbi:MAG: winged helix-turn-helix transcriptional regulator [Anaerolineae bacterium]|nr:winged helix-turn-helix transcriptional regulator [Anaerolineae bacterium]
MNTTILTALAEPNRLRIVEYLREGPRSVGEIATRLQIRQPQASKHLRVLSDAGIVHVRPVAQQRVYQLQAKPFEELDSWLETFRKVWEDRLDTLDAYLQELKTQTDPDEAEPKP